MFKWIINTSLITTIFSFRKRSKRKDSNRKVFGHTTLMKSKNLQTAKKVQLGWMTPTSQNEPISLKLMDFSRVSMTSLLLHRNEAKCDNALTNVSSKGKNLGG